MANVWGVRFAVFSAVLLCLASPCTRGENEPFPWVSSNWVEVVNLGIKTCDDVIGNPFNEDEIFATKTGNDFIEIWKLTLSRSDDGDITGSTLDWSSESPLPYTFKWGLKALDMYNDDTIFYILEQGGADGDGLVGSLTGLDGTPVHVEAADLTAAKSPGESSPFDPEGIAVDRQNDFVYAMNDDGPTEVAQYSVNPATLALTYNWTKVVATSGDNGNDGIVLSDGRVALTDGNGTCNIYAVTPDGNASVNLLGGSVSGDDDGPQDLLEYRGYLYLLWEGGVIDAFDASDLDNMSRTKAASWDLDAILGANVICGGMGVTARGELLISTREGGSKGSRAFAFEVIPAEAFPQNGAVMHLR